MQHHHSRVSWSLQPTIDSLPSISDLSLNLISFSLTSPENGFGPVHLYVFEWLHVYDALRVCCICACLCMCPHSFGKLSAGLSLVNRVPNQVFIVIIVILCLLIVNHTLSRAIFVESRWQSFRYKHCLNAEAGLLRGYWCLVVIWSGCCFI